jgi:hypothetical protein
MDSTLAPSGRNWWSYPKGGSVSGAVVAAVNQIQETTLGLQTRLLRSARLFGGYGYMSGGRFPTSAGAGGPLAMGVRTGPRDNIVYSVISTVCSQLLDDGAPGVRFLTSHGDWELQRKSELLEQFTDGLFYQVGFDAESTFCLYDACIFGTGFMKYSVDADNNILAERIFPSEIMVDIWDGRDRKPRSLYQVGFVDRDVLATRNPEKRKLIMQARPQMPTGFTPISTNSTNVIPFVEAWHLPTSAEAEDGRHVLTLADELVIKDEKYSEMDFPFSVIRFEHLPTGYYGMGISELLQGHQLSLNDANRAEYWSWSQVATPRLWMQTGSLDKNHLNSSLSGIILEGNTPPQVLNWSATHPDFVAWKADIRSNAFQEVGVSQLTSSGVKPAGLNSGEAQRVYADQQHSRFAILSQRWLQFRVDAAKKMIALARHVYTQEGAFEVKVIGKNFVKTVDLKDADIEDDEYRMQALPVNQLPKSVSGRIQTATELLQAGLIDVDTGRKLMQLPDVDEALDLANAATDNAKRTAYLMLHEGKPCTPDPIQDLAQCVKVITAEALRAIDNDAPPERIKLCRNFLVQARALLQPPPPPSMTAPPVGGGAPSSTGSPPPPPLAAGAPPPVSQLLPFKQAG